MRRARRLFLLWCARPGGPPEEELQACLVVVVVTCQTRTALSSPHDANKVGSVGHHLHLWLPHKTGGEHMRHPRVYRLFMGSSFLACALAGGGGGGGW